MELWSFICSRWSKGGVPISEANGDSLEVTVDYSYFTDPVSCEVSNSVGSTNVSTLVDVQCKFNWRQTLYAVWFLCFQILKVEQLFKKSLLLILTGRLHCFPSSWPQTAVGAETHDSGYRHGCSLHLCVDWKPSSDPGLDQARLQCGKATTTKKKSQSPAYFLDAKASAPHLSTIPPERNIHTWPWGMNPSHFFPHFLFSGRYFNTFSHHSPWGLKPLAENCLSYDRFIEHHQSTRHVVTIPT